MSTKSDSQEIPLREAVSSSQTARTDLNDAHPPSSSFTGSSVSFSHISYTIKTKTGEKKLINDVSVKVKAGELLAIMGPSGAGKSTLLDLMSTRKTFASGGSMSLNGSPLSPKDMLKISSFVEQEDALLGVLSVRETISYSLRLSLPKASRAFVSQRVNRIIDLLGLASCAETRIGTPIQRGISGGQKRRVSVACSLVAFPRVLFLDEPTSGLDSTSAREVMFAVRRVAREEGIIIVASIHQPSLETCKQFTDLLLLTGGQICYNGPMENLDGFLAGFGKPVGKFVSRKLSSLRLVSSRPDSTLTRFSLRLAIVQVNPTDSVMDLLNTDFASSPANAAVESSSSSNDKADTRTTAEALRSFYLSTVPTAESTESAVLPDKDVHAVMLEHENQEGKGGKLASLWGNTYVLSERTTKNYSRNLLAYGIRAGMYVGMAVMIALIWINIGYDASRINDRLSVHFYAIAFLAFMSVAGIPGFLEERAVFKKERTNGLYSTLPFVLSNTVVTIPFLFVCSLFFVLIMYWAVGLHPGGRAAFRFLGILFLSIFAAESQVVLVASLLPVFIAALAIAAFINGFWMSVGGYFLKARNLPRFWFYSFHWMNYQKYSFELLANSDLDGLTFDCSDAACPYPSTLGGNLLSGRDVLVYLEIADVSYANWIGILISIIVIYRIALFFSLKYVKKW
ncbi:P-loop containing nucleoside triphosphate hydrolase protein [Mrakia frigida]|uniref:P-loop containing nucleoside triphosphate hydrolase protein n=1 Tax=Mrakia frigida TaxID=29902 RepID=UPI003FCBFF5C